MTGAHRPQPDLEDEAEEEVEDDVEEETGLVALLCGGLFVVRCIPGAYARSALWHPIVHD